jgi:hypothetical protein
VWWWQTGCGFPKLGREEHQRGMNHHRRQRKSLGVCIISRSDQRRWGFSPLAHLSGARRQQKHMIHMRRCDAMRCDARERRRGMMMRAVRLLSLLFSRGEARRGGREKEDRSSSRTGLAWRGVVVSCRGVVWRSVRGAERGASV